MKKIELQLSESDRIEVQCTDKLLQAVKKELCLSETDNVSDQEIAKVILRWTVSALDKPPVIEQ